MKPLVIISSWFGPWPLWIEFYLETVRWNAEIDWIIATDQLPPRNTPPNVRYIHLGFDQMLSKMSAAIDLDLSMIDKPYKLCDLKPALGHAFATEIRGYRSYGYADIDVFFGNLRGFLTDEVIERFDVISASRVLLTGYFAVFRNTDRLRCSFKQIWRWRDLAPRPAHHGLDEHPYRRVFMSRRQPLAMIQGLWWQRAFGTVIEHRGVASRATWLNGRLSGDDQSQELPFLHLMRWQSNRWRRDDAAPWPHLGESLVQMDWREARENGFVASTAGIHKPAKPQ